MRRRRLLLVVAGLIGIPALAAVVVPRSAWEALMQEVSSDHNASWKRDASGQLVATSDKSPDQSYNPLASELPTDAKPLTATSSTLSCVGSGALALSTSGASAHSETNELTGHWVLEKGGLVCRSPCPAHETLRDDVWDAETVRESIELQPISNGEYKVIYFNDSNLSFYWSTAKRVSAHIYEAEYNEPFDNHPPKGGGWEGSCVKKYKVTFEVMCSAMKLGKP
jgi:hypothetical protein